jgi:hypothetical protein
VEPGSGLPIRVLELVTPEQEFEELRQRFHERLQRERVRLSQLAEALAGGKVDSALVVGDLGMFAHRLRGAALVFEYTGIGDAAKAVELAAGAALLRNKVRRDLRQVVATMQVLAMKLTEETTGRALSAPQAVAE